jgi:hypothetical protein
MRDFFAKLFNTHFGGSGEKNTAEIIKLEKLQIRIDQIIKLAQEQASRGVKPEDGPKLQVFLTCLNLY